MVEVGASHKIGENSHLCEHGSGGSSNDQNGTAGGLKPFSCCSITSSPAASIETANPILACCWTKKVISTFSCNQNLSKAANKE